MSFTLELTEEQEALREKAHIFARDVIRPAAAEYDRAQEFPWPVIEEAARQGCTSGSSTRSCRWIRPACHCRS